MANIKVSELAEATSFDNGDYTMIIQGNQNKKISKENMLANVGDISDLETTDKSNVVNSINSLIPIVLFDGETTGNVTLNDDSKKYSSLEIFYESTGNYNSVKVLSPNGKNVFLISAWFGNNVDGNIKIAKIKISNNIISKINYTAFKYGGSDPAFEENSITIRKVLGYK